MIKVCLYLCVWDQLFGLCGTASLLMDAAAPSSLASRLRSTAAYFQMQGVHDFLHPLQFRGQFLSQSL